MKTVIIIPARHASQRFPGKPLAMLEDAAGVRKSLIQRSWEAAMAVPGIAGVFVATDDSRILDAAHGFGAEAIMTSPDCDNGTARCADALDVAGLEADLVVNLQGDAPLTPAWFVSDLVAAMADRPDIDMATPVLRCDAATYAHFREDRQAGRVGGTTAVFDAAGRALYFSKEVIPHIDPARSDSAFGEVFHHVGLYAYRPDALRRYAGWPPARLERLEGLEQLRFLEHGAPVLCVEVDARGRTFWELNNPEDIARIEQVLKTQG